MVQQRIHGDGPVAGDRIMRPYIYIYIGECIQYILLLYMYIYSIYTRADYTI